MRLERIRYDKTRHMGMRWESWTKRGPGFWSGYDELDTRLRAKGVQDGPKKKAIRQAVQGLGGEGGPARGNDGQRPVGGTRHKGLDAEKMGLRMRGDGRRRVPRKRISEDQQGSRTAKPKKKAVELERENEMLKNFRAFSSQDHARGAGSSKSIGARSAPSRRHAGR